MIIIGKILIVFAVGDALIDNQKNHKNRHNVCAKKNFKCFLCTYIVPAALTMHEHAVTVQICFSHPLHQETSYIYSCAFVLSPMSIDCFRLQAAASDSSQLFLLAPYLIAVS